MKLRHSLIIGCLTAVLGFGAFLGAGANKEVKVEKVEATTMPQYIYLDNIWVESGADTAKYWVQAWKEGGALTKKWMTITTNGLFMVDLESTSYTYDQIIFFRVSPSTTEFITSGDGFWNQTIDLSIPTNGNNTLKLWDNCTNGNWVTRENVADGTYLSGVYHGNSWTSNISFSSSIVTEYASYDDTYKEFYATVELYAGDYFKFVQFSRGESSWHTTASISSSDGKYYPVDWEGNNVKVTNAGVYYLKAGIISGDPDESKNGKEYYYVDSTAANYAYRFLNSMTCDGDGIALPSFNEGFSWSVLATEYGNLDSYAKHTFYTATSDDGGTNIERMISRHFTIVANHNKGIYAGQYNPFITDSDNTTYRNASAFVNIPSSFKIEGDNATTMIAVVAAVAALITAAGFFFLKKKKTF